jgi:phage shock protein PspC (stress-responsive transcriptional regulator)
MNMTNPEQPEQPEHSNPLELPAPETAAEHPSYGTPRESAAARVAARTETPPGARFFDAVRGLGVVRPDDGRWAAGVCAGLARRWGISPMAVRGLFVLVSLLAGVGLAMYGLLWIFLPHPDGRIHAQEVLKGTVTAGFVGAAVATVFGGPFAAAPWGPGPWHHGPGLFPLILIALVVWWIARRGRTNHAHHGN